MAKTYDNWEDLVAAAQQRCSQVLDKKVAPLVKEIVRRHIKTDIYDAYTPKEDGWVGSDGRPATYKRRMLLLKPGGVYHKFSNTRKDEILVTSDVTASPAVVKGWSFHTHGRPGSFLKLLESGNMGIWSKGFPRPAVSNAQKEVDNNREILAVMEAELNR